MINTIPKGRPIIEMEMIKPIATKISPTPKVSKLPSREKIRPANFQTNWNGNRIKLNNTRNIS